MGKEMLKGLGQLGDMAKLMKQAQDMQSKMSDIQKQLEELNVEGESGGGLIKATVNAKGTLKSLNIDESLIGIKATTNEKLGPEGREEGISCHSVVLLEKKNEI